MTSSQEKIAIIGMSCLFPGAANPDAFWQNLIQARNTTSQATAEQFGVDPAIYFDPQRTHHDTTYFIRGGYIQTPIEIDSEQIKHLDRVYQWSYYVVSEALRDAGYRPQVDDLSRCGLLLGNLSFPTQASHALLAPLYDSELSRIIRQLLNQDINLQHSEPSKIDPWNAHAFGGPGALMSKLFGFNGPHFTLDAACGASLYTVGLACEYLLSGNADLMLAGAVNAADPLFINMGFTHFGAYPANGDSRPLDATSGGLVAGEGAAMFVLKRHSDAVRDGDHIHAVIAGVGLANDGRGKHALTPNPRGQLLALQRAYASGEIDPAYVQYVECHASGTPLGDKTEISSLDEFFGGRSQAPAIGSVKSNLGHLLTVAGMASMLKVILSMQHEMIPATLGIEQPLTLNRSSLTANSVIQANTPWTSEHKFAGVNAFGFGGVSAHIVLTDQITQDQPVEASPPGSNPLSMAIVGMDLHFGDVDNLDDFAETIYEGRQHFRPLPPNRWRGLHANQASEGAYIASFDIDYMRFKFPPKEDDQPIPQQLLLLKVADGAIRDAGLHEGDNVAVIVAMATELSLHQYRERLDLSWQIQDALKNANISFSETQTNALVDAVKDAISPPAQVNQYTSAIGNIASSRVSAHWNFSGPAFTLSALENSVFAALEVAQLLLRDTALDAVVVGAVDLAGGVESVLSRSQQHPLDSRETPTMSFDQSSTGWNVGEGAGAVVIKRVDHVRPNERVYATIDGLALISAVQQGNIVQQAAETVLSATGLQPADIGYLEAHASGIADQDAVEMQGLTQAYKADSGLLTTALGSIKANLGHSFTASGMVSLIKTALCLYHRMLPVTPNWNKPKTDADWDNSQFYVPESSRTWVIHADQPRRAGISSLAMDGSAAHIILTEASSNLEHRYLQSRLPKLLLIDADTKPGLMGRIGQLETAIADGTPLFTLALRAFNVYQNKPLVLALVAKDIESLRKEIDAAKSAVVTVIDQGGEWQTPAGSYFTAKPLGKSGGVAFVYPGAFNSYPGLGQDWMHLFPEAYEHLLTLTDNPPANLADTALYQRSLEAPDRASVRAFRAGLQDHPIAMMASGTTFSVLYTQVLRETFQVKPQTAFGYSLGEGSMFWSFGVWQGADAANERFRTSDLFHTRLFGRKQAVREAWALSESTPDDFWASFVLVAPASDVAQALERESHVYITHINTPNETVIAGDSTACQRVIQQLNVNSVKAPFEVVIHNDAMLSEFEAFYRLHYNDVNGISGIQFYSAADYAPVALTSDSIARSMARMICKPIDFPRLVRRAYETGARIFIELGPGSTCTRWIHESLDDEPHLAASIDNLRADDYTGLIKLLARLSSHRVLMNLSHLFANAAEESPARGRNSIKTITLGGERIADMLLTPENRQRFGTAQPVASPPVETGVSAPAAVQEAVAVPVMSAVPVASTVNAAPPSTSTNARLASLRDFENEIRQKLSGRQPVQSIQPAAVETAKRSTMPPVVNRFEPRPALFDTERIDQFARGRIANCFGPEYGIYDNQRAPRIPNTDLMFVSRVVEMGAERLVTRPGSTLVMEYDVPTDIWFYRDNSAPFTPYSVLMEMALQPCGFLSAYMGPTLAYPDIDFYFRNLDGAATLHREVDLRGRTLTNRVELLSSTTLQGIIIQKYSFEMILDGQPFYVGTSTFGYFTLQALSSQAGLDMGKPPAKWHEANPNTALRPVTGDRGVAPTRASGVELPHGQLAFLDGAQVAISGGTYNQGYIWGTSKVSPSDWFFKCHFHQDPVMPGSLGLETITQAIQAYMIEAGLDKDFSNPRFGHVENHEVTWKYRGQVLSDSEQINVEVSIKSVERRGDRLAIIADASLWKGALRIYQFNNVAVAIVEGSEG
jgi:PfaB family protein